jgi:hypothetical protein
MLGHGRLSFQWRGICIITLAEIDREFIKLRRQGINLRYCNFITFSRREGREWFKHNRSEGRSESTNAAGIGNHPFTNVQSHGIVFRYGNLIKKPVGFA